MRDGRWRVSGGLWFPLGERAGDKLTEEEYDDPSVAVWGGGAWEAWSYAGIAAGAEIGAALGDQELAYRCLAITSSWDRQEIPKPEDLIRWLEWAAA
jgi:hypothetical protein